MNFLCPIIIIPTRVNKILSKESYDDHDEVQLGMGKNREYLTCFLVSAGNNFSSLAGRVLSNLHFGRTSHQLSRH